MSLKPGLGSLKVIVTDTHRPVIYHFLLAFNSYRTVSEINSNFGRKSQFFPTPCIFSPRWRSSHWNWAPALGAKKTTMMGLPDWTWSSTISLAVWIQCTNKLDTLTETPSGRQQRPRLRIASRGENDEITVLVIKFWFSWYLCIL